MTLPFPKFSWRASARYTLLPALTLGALTACSDSTSPGATGSGRVRFVALPYPDALSPDGKTALLRAADGSGNLYFYDVATQKLTLKTTVGTSFLDVAHGLSNNGVIAASYGDPVQAALWSEANGWQIIPSQYPAGCDPNVSDAWDVSADASVSVGIDWTATCRVSAYRWSGGVKTALEVLGAPFVGDTNPPPNRASVVSGDGSVMAGWGQSAAGQWMPAVWNADGSGFLIPTRGVFADDCSGNVLALNTDGSMAAGVWCQHAFYWTQAGGVVDLGQLPGTDPNDEAFANAIAADGQLIFGTNGNGFFGPQQATFWTAASGTRPLQQVLSGYIWPDQRGYILENALHASTDGTVVIGQALDPQGRPVTYVASVPVSAYGL